MTCVSGHKTPQKPSLELRHRVLSAIDYAPGNTIRARIKNVSERTFVDQAAGVEYRFTWRTISTWLYRFKLHGITTLDNRTRSDKNCTRVNSHSSAEQYPVIQPN